MLRTFFHFVKFEFSFQKEQIKLITCRVTLTWIFFFFHVTQFFYCLAKVNYEFSSFFAFLLAAEWEKNCFLWRIPFAFFPLCECFSNFCLFVRQSLLMIDIWINSSTLSFFHIASAARWKLPMTLRLLIKSSWQHVSSLVFSDDKSTY